MASGDTGALLFTYFYALLYSLMSLNPGPAAVARFMFINPVKSRYGWIKKILIRYSPSFSSKI